MQKTVPKQEDGISEDELKRAEELWVKALNSEPLSVAVDMNNLTTCIESKARFTEAQYKADEPVQIEVFVR